MRILGIDPGSIRTGYAVIEHHGQKLHHVCSGHLALGQGAMPERLARIHKEIQQIIAEFEPATAAIETVFVQRNVQSALKLGQARGAAIAAIAGAELSIAEYQPTKVKQSICGVGRASKDQVGFMVGRLLNLKQELQEDQADAVAVAICHAFHRPQTSYTVRSRG